MIEDSNNNMLATLGKQDYLTILTKKKKTRWDDNYKPYVKNLSRRTRWGAEYEKSFTPIPFTNIPDNLTIDDFEILIRKYRLEDLTRRIISSDFENADPDLRSPSPEPVYDSKTGVRLNTRDVRTKENYVKEKNSIIEELILLDESFIPPSDYKPPKKTKKLLIPDSDSANFVGLILGPNGQSQRELEKKSGCKISIRGIGSNWNNFAKDKTYHDETEPLHVYIQADTEEQLRKGISLIEPLLDPTTEEHIRHKMFQKQALAVKLGLVNEHGCENCGERGHRTWACPLNLGNFDKPQIQCEICKDKSHPTCDCPLKKSNVEADSNDIENEYSKFIKEINEFKQKSDVLILEDEVKSMDIRNSVVWTGKIPEQFKNKPEGEEKNQQQDEKKDSDEKQEKIDENSVSVNPKATEQFSINLSELDENTSTNKTEIKPPSSTIPNSYQDAYLKVDYKVPMQPISDNKNVISAAPVLNNMMNHNMQNANLSGIINPQNNTYYNTYINPYAFNTPGYSYLNMMKMPAANQRNYMRNILPNNFQGKIPINQYGSQQAMYGGYPSMMPPIGRQPMYNNQMIPSYNVINQIIPNVTGNSVPNIGIPLPSSKPPVPGNGFISPPESENSAENIPMPPEPEIDDNEKMNNNQNEDDVKIE